jgi:Concanavalin A-like lectin/glucanases superfamily
MKKILLFVWAALCMYSSHAQPTAGLVAYWPMNGNFNDGGPNALNGSNSGTTATTDRNGQANSAMNFANPSTTATNVAQFALLPSSSLLNFSGTQNFSISFWAYVNSPVIHPGGIFDNNLNTAGPGVWMWNANGFPQVQFNYKNLSVGTPNAAFPLATWFNVVCARNNGTISIYINGVLSVSGAEGSTAPTYPIAARFGTMSSTSFPPSYNYNGFNGKLDEMRIYNRALSALEIAGLAVLPVQLNSFTATKNNADVLLRWQTDEEVNNSHFNVQRSSDGINFTDIAQVNASGTASAPANYQYLDITVKAIAATTIYYRLQQVDKDGRKKLSDILLVKYSPASNLLTLLQNPVHDVLRLQINMPAKETVSVVVTNAAGQQVLVKNLPLNPGDNFTSIPVQQLAKGMYHITLLSASGKQTLPFAK